MQTTRNRTLGPSVIVGTTILVVGLVVGTTAAGIDLEEQHADPQWLEFPVERTGEHLESIANSPFVSPLPSADLFDPGDETPEGLRPFVVGRTPGTAGGGYTWEGEDVPAQDIYGFKVSDPDDDRAKPVIVFISGQHPRESHSMYTQEGTIDVIVDPDHPDGMRLRSMADFYIYPQVNPEGRWARVGRSNPQNPGQDNNRTWSSPEGWSNVEIVREAMYHDLEGREIRYFLDYHAPGATGSSIFHYVTPHSAASPFAQFSVNGGIRMVLAGGGPRLAYGWSMQSWDDGGLGADYGFTPEIGRRTPDEPDSYREVGEWMAHAMANAMHWEHLDGPPAAGVEFRFDFDNSRSPEARGWNVIATNLEGYRYPMVDAAGEVTAVQFTIPSGLERSGTGNWPPGTALPDWADHAAADGYVSFEEDLELLVEGLGEGRTFDIQWISSRPLSDSGPLTGDGEAGYSTRLMTFERVSTDSDGNLSITIEVGEEPGVLNAMRVIESPAR